jgi:hypothetical protein
MMKQISMMIACLLTFSVLLYAQDEPQQPEIKKSATLKVEIIGISLTEEGPKKPDKTVKAGEKIFIHFSVKGLSPIENKVTIQADLYLPQLGIKVKNIIDETYDYEKNLLLQLNGPIPSDAAGGLSNARIVIRDMNASTYAESTTVFTIIPGKTPERLAKSDKIKISLYSISLEERGQMKQDRTFKAGETAYVNLEVKGLQANKENKAVIQADLLIPEIGIDDKNIVDAATDHEDSLPVYFKVSIESVYQNAVCNVKIVIRDMVAKTFVEYTTSFKVMK